MVTESKAGDSAYGESVQGKPGFSTTDSALLSLTARRQAAS